MKVSENVQRSESEEFQPINSQQRPTLEEYLIKNYQEKTMFELKKESGLSSSQINYAALKLGLKKLYKCEYCDRRAYKKHDSKWMCNECYWLYRGSKCVDCGKETNARAERCLECKYKYVAKLNQTHLDNYCPFCNKKISFQHKTCGKKLCQEKHRIQKGILIERFCSVCHKRFTITHYASKVKAGKFCSQKCYKEVFFPAFNKRNMGFQLDGKHMRSSWEVRIADLLNQTKIKWQYEPQKFNNYIPDFYLPELNIYLEVKGYMSQKSLDKIRQFRKLGNTIYIVNPSIYKRLNTSEDMIRFTSSIRPSV